VVIETSERMSRRGAGNEKMCVSCCGRVGCDAFGSGSCWYNVGGVIVGGGLWLFVGLPGKVTMVMMTLLAFLCRKACRVGTKDFYTFLAVKYPKLWTKVSSS